MIEKAILFQLRLSYYRHDPGYAPASPTQLGMIINLTGSLLKSKADQLPASIIQLSPEFIAIKIS
jgi:hypothetical protein